MNIAGIFSPIIFFIKEYIVPSGIVATVIAVIWDRVNEIGKRKKESVSKKESIKDTLLVVINKINIFFESLRIDAEQNGYFAFKNLNSVKPMVDKIQLIADNDVFVFQDNDHLRTEIISLGTYLTSLWSDLNNLEILKNNEDNRLSEALTRQKVDLKNIKLKLLSQGIEVDQYNSPMFINKKGDKNILRATTTILGECMNTFTEASQNYNNLIQSLKDRRIFYSIKILDAQTKLKHLEDLLSNS